MQGGHAVVVLGWGEEKVTAINPDTRKPYGKVGYWIVRNSWGDSWNGDGYFKMAMYPHNKFSQFDMGMDAGVGSDGKTLWLGGMFLIEYDKEELIDVDSIIELETDKYDTIKVKLPDRIKYEGATASHTNVSSDDYDRVEGNEDGTASRTNVSSDDYDRVEGDDGDGNEDGDGEGEKNYYKIALTVLIVIIILAGIVFGAQKIMASRKKAKGGSA
jgi:hypothetical protein